MISLSLAGFGAVLLFASPVAAVQQPAPSRAPLQKAAFHPLPLGSVKPDGWMRAQLRAQADGLTGHLDEFWPDLSPKSAWLGGDGEGWERGPYYLDGLLPLAHLLDDPQLIAKANKWVEWAITNQREDGSIGPAKNKDWWPNMIMLKALTQHQEATGDPRVIPLMQRYFRHRSANVAARPLFEWARYRWQEEVLSILWLYNRSGDKDLLELARRIAQQGFDWQTHLANFPFKAKTTREMLGLVAQKNSDTALSAHNVNIAMALKTSPVWWQVSGRPEDRAALTQQLAMLDRYHGLPNGMFSGDEHVAGTDPTQGIELCGVVEAMFSLEHAVAALGDSRLADRLERIAYNALPATISPDMWSHQYDQQPNQVMCSRAKRAWTSNGANSNLFGLEPNFGCCTANMHQGWPKLVSHSWMATPDGGLAVIAYMPNVVTTELSGVRVQVRQETDYPFSGTIRFRVDPAKKVRFPLVLRIPEWGKGAQILVNGKTVGQPAAAAFHRVTREWKAGDQVELRLPEDVRTSRWHNGSVAFERGPLVYALKIGEDWRRIVDRPNAADDFEVHPTSLWNYGVLLSAKPTFVPRSISSTAPPWTPAGVPELRVRGVRLPAWTMLNDSAGPLPQSPVSVKAETSSEELVLIPYGAARLRITAFPLIER
ncbi:MAG TPA: beta-L-arabinofuranosidase domain-containing protein [Bryobacteraceae bacterium]|nr:beta-L-arabinofuranosidase domain-containing protein [Bryobacteraceae bacterium]